ncbi:carbohydrate-binding module family 1 protein [Neurospora crassa]|uniref:CBM1 domain-containing protein n=1 Tax=Neurospora crassa (strain ATCC 24698 / 74-OR23-1A / CBS 708.71 / DSM 1257 / FGSC 987) TaxID=367110 RepID=Q7S197_NEUCR|nr:hypothetical protein NCU09764 [Neurospora crassa OR74A]EAA29112.1 hypothetical protein NCU09764 [Neurospora crassa OR74A]KHE79050.1 carbohydrate-binding module family 1 protein [Neurospora crassa]|eukprot:XP_958348.1 hypothetical protein NCU09764 [Neurospora crassa OR74A]
MKFTLLSGLVAQALSVSAGSILWDGRFNDLTSATDLSKWSWSSQVGPYQYYIHGPSEVTSYVNLSPSFKNPADSGSSQGAKITLDKTAFWNGQTMRRTELIPQTTAAINKGKVFYHFSLMRKDTNAPALTREHQIAFFESHFTELKSGWQSGAAGTSDPLLRWCIGGQTKWSVNWDADVWHNVAYEIDFDANTVGFWHSTGSDALTQVIAPQAAGTSSNGADWHVGVLELPRDGYADATEDFYFSGVYIESGSITTSVAGPGSSSSNPGTPSAPSSSSAVPVKPSTSSASVAPVKPSTSSTSSSTTVAAVTSSAAPVKPSTSSASSSTTVAAVTSASAAPAVTTSKAGTKTCTRKSSAAPAATTSAGSCTAARYAQCGGKGFSGCTACASPYKCNKVNDWYSQCY